MCIHTYKAPPRSESPSCYCRFSITLPENRLRLAAAMATKMKTPHHTKTFSINSFSLMKMCYIQYIPIVCAQFTSFLYIYLNSFATPVDSRVRRTCQSQILYTARFQVYFFFFEKHSLLSRHPTWYIMNFKPRHH